MYHNDGMLMDGYVSTCNEDLRVCDEYSNVVVWLRCSFCCFLFFNEDSLQTLVSHVMAISHIVIGAENNAR